MQDRKEKLFDDLAFASIACGTFLVLIGLIIWFAQDLKASFPPTAGGTQFTITPGPTPFAPYQSYAWYNLNQPGGTTGPYAIYDVPAGEVGKQYFQATGFSPLEITCTPTSHSGSTVELHCSMAPASANNMYYPCDWTGISPQPSSVPGMSFLTNGLAKASLVGIPTQAGTYIMDVLIDIRSTSASNTIVGQGRRLYRITIHPAGGPAGGSSSSSSGGGDDSGGGCVVQPDETSPLADGIIALLVFGGLIIAFKRHNDVLKAREDRRKAEEKAEFELQQKVNTLWKERSSSA